MLILQQEVSRALSGLSHRVAPPEGEPLFGLVKDTLQGLGVELERVKRVDPGQFRAKWHRKGEVLTEETTFTLLEMPFVTEWS